MTLIQKELLLGERKRGFHLITAEILAALPELSGIHCGLLHLFIKHTSASLTINENADPDVRKDLETHFRVLAPENAHYYTHDTEGADDMPAHIKAALLGSTLIMPITGGRLNIGTWQGIYLCEHREHGGRRSIVATIISE